MWKRVRVAGDSMSPTIRPGEGLLVSTGAYRRLGPRAGDIVLAWHPDRSRKIVKRVVGLPGSEFERRRLGPDEYYVRGDNPHATTDSDSFGPLSKAALLGRVWFSTTRWRRLR